MIGFLQLSYFLFFCGAQGTGIELVSEAVSDAVEVQFPTGGINNLAVAHGGTKFCQFRPHRRFSAHFCVNPETVSDRETRSVAIGGIRFQICCHLLEFRLTIPATRNKRETEGRTENRRAEGLNLFAHDTPLTCCSGGQAGRVAVPDPRRAGLRDRLKGSSCHVPSSCVMRRGELYSLVRRRLWALNPARTADAPAFAASPGIAVALVRKVRRARGGTHHHRKKF